jgi:hypothetical protein
VTGLLHAWASTTPADYGHMPRPGSPCAVPSCRKPLLADQTVYAVIEHGGPDAPEVVPCLHGPLTSAKCGHTCGGWVCWRHVDRNDREGFRDGYVEVVD